MSDIKISDLTQEQQAELRSSIDALFDQLNRVSELVSTADVSVDSIRGALEAISYTAWQSEIELAPDYEAE